MKICTDSKIFMALNNRAQFGATPGMLQREGANRREYIEISPRDRQLLGLFTRLELGCNLPDDEKRNACKQKGRAYVAALEDPELRMIGEVMIGDKPEAELPQDLLAIVQELRAWRKRNTIDPNKERRSRGLDRPGRVGTLVDYHG